MDSSQPFPLRQICLNDLLNADLSSIVTSLSQPHGKIEDSPCSNLILEGTIQHRWDFNQAASARPAVVENELQENGTTDIERSTKLFSADPPIQIGDIDLSSLAQDFCQDDVEEILKEGQRGGFFETSPKPTAKRRRVVMSNPTHAGPRSSVDLTSGEMQWLEPLGLDSQGNKVFGAAFRGAGNQDPLYICGFCCVLLRAAESSDSFYIARVTKLYERCTDGAKMVSCQWFFKKEDTVLAHRKGSANRVGKQELFESDSVDENSLHAIEDVCEVLAEPLLFNVQSWLSDPKQANMIDSERYYYGSKYIPSLKCFKALNDEDMRIARVSYAASSRAVEQTTALRMIGDLKRNTLLPAADGLMPSFVRVSLKLRKGVSYEGERISLRHRAVLGSEWQSVLSGEAYRLIASKTVSVSSRVGIPNSNKDDQCTLISPESTSIEKQAARCPADSNDVSKCNAPVSGICSCALDTASVVDISSTATSNAPPSVSLETEGFSSIQESPIFKDPVATHVNLSCCINRLSADGQDKNQSQELTTEGSNINILFATSDQKNQENSIVCIPPADSSGLSSPLICSSPSCESVSALPELVAQNHDCSMYQTPPAHAPRAFHSAPRLQLAPTQASSQLRAKSARKERERQNQGEFRSVRSAPRRGLQVEFSGPTASQLISRKLSKFDAQHSSITWIGPGRRGSEGRTCFSAAMLSSGQTVSVGSSVKLIAERKACFLARISEMWETERDGLKMMRCRWFCRPGETLLSNHSAAISIAEHPREVFLDESGCDENFMTTIVSRTVILHKDHLPPNFDLNLLQCGDCYFFSRSYSRQTRQLSPVPASPMCAAVKEDVHTLLEIQATCSPPGGPDREIRPGGGGEAALRHVRPNGGPVFPDNPDWGCFAQPQ